MKRSLLIAACLLTCLRVFAADAKLESHLRHKVFIIRGFYTDNKLVYDGQGNVQGTPQVGPWTLAGIRVDNVEVRDSELVIEGKRAAEIYHRDNNQFVGVVPKHPDKVQIRVNVPAASLSRAALRSVVDRILEEKVRADEVPEWWRPFVAGKAGRDNDLPSEHGIPRSGSDKDRVFRLGSAGLVPPTVLHQEHPDYQEAARQAKLQGVTILSLVVNREGVPERIYVTDPIGMGLDDAAVQAVRTWRFKPGVLKGQPVPVLLSVEVAFRLY